MLSSAPRKQSMPFKNLPLSFSFAESTVLRLEVNCETVFVIPNSVCLLAVDIGVNTLREDLETANNLIRNSNKTSHWYASNLLKRNLSKYQTMSLKHNSTISDIPLHFQGNPIESSGSLKVLELTIDDQLNLIFILMKYIRRRVKGSE